MLINSQDLPWTQTWELAISIPLFVLFALMIHYIFQRYLTLAFYLGWLFLITSPVCYLHTKPMVTWFFWLKLYAIILAWIIFASVRYADLHNKSSTSRWISKYRTYLLYGIYIINVVGASVGDFLQQRARIYNGVAGVLLACATPFPTRDNWTVSTGSRRYLITQFNWLYILLYVSWNTLFVIEETGAACIGLLLILPLALLVARFEQPEDEQKYRQHTSQWLTARATMLMAYSLANGYFGLITTLGYLTTHMNFDTHVSNWNDIVMWWGFGNISLGALVYVVFVYQQLSLTRKVGLYDLAVSNDNDDDDDGASVTLVPSKEKTHT